MPKLAAPEYSRRVKDAAELQLAITDALRVAGLVGSEVKFNGVVKLEADDISKDGFAAVTLTILKRN